ncbi:hypothetical protein LJK88_46215 [Paenibacillus sp. P26]|nr:hypothetical protein LJK88_46215 [Paenibacillus sp. P26]
MIVPALTAKHPAQFLQPLKERRVTILNQTPTYFYQLLREALAEGGEELSIRKVIFGGRGAGTAAAEGLEDAIPEHAANQYVRDHGNDRARNVQRNNRSGN